MAEPTTKRDLAREAHIRAIGVATMAWGALALLAAAATVVRVGGVPGPSSYWGGVVLPALAALTAPGVLLVAAGRALWGFRSWARRTLAFCALPAAIVAFAAFAMVLFETVTGPPAPKGNFPGVFILIIAGLVVAWNVAIFARLIDATTTRLCSEEHRAVVASDATTAIPWTKSPYFLAAVGLVVLTVALLAAGGFRP